jgi:hypothetical protein
MTKPNYIHSFSLNGKEERLLQRLKEKKVKVIEVVREGLRYYAEETLNEDTTKDV